MRSSASSVKGEWGWCTCRQRPPLQRQVALKIVKPGMDSKQVLARFEAERQAWHCSITPISPMSITQGRPPTARPYLRWNMSTGRPSPSSATSTL